MRREQK